MAMSDTTTTVSTATETSGIFAEAVGGIATIVLAIIALGGTSEPFLLAIATIVFGAALLIEATSIGTDYIHLPAAFGAEAGAGGLGAVLLAGVAGIILGVLALIGIFSTVLTAAAVIVFGSAMILSSSAMASLQSMKSRVYGGSSFSMVSSATSGAQALAGIAVIVLGILSVSGVRSQPLALVGLLVLGAALLATGNGMNNAFVAAFRTRATERGL